MNRIASISLIVALASLLIVGSGCSRAISGHYELVRATPNPDDFSMDDVDFTRDGRYTAKVTLGGRTSRESGTYEFNGYKLTLRPAGGGRRKYNASAGPKKLSVFIEEKKVILRKASAPDKSEDQQ